MTARRRGLFSLFIYIENFKNLLVRNHWTNFNIILQKCSFSDPLPRLFKQFVFVKKHGHQGRGLFSLCIYIEKFKNLLVRNLWTDFNIILQKCSFGNPLPRLFKPFGFVKKHGHQDAFALFHWHFYCNSFTREEDCIQNLLCTQRTFGNYWAFAVFSGPDLIANLSDGLKIMDPGFITCDDIGKLLFIIFWKHLKQLFGHFNPLPLLLVSQQMWHPSSRNLSDFQMLVQNKVNR